MRWRENGHPEVAPTQAEQAGDGAAEQERSLPRAVAGRTGDPPPAAQAAYDTTVSRWLTNQRRPLPTANEEKRQRLHEEVGPALAC